METTCNITSIGRTCCVLQRSYKSIERAIVSLGIEPVATIDGVPYLDDADVERIGQHLADQTPTGGGSHP